MKKVISIMLALVMVLGIMSVGTLASAESVWCETAENYTDNAALAAVWAGSNGLATDPDNDGNNVIKVAGTGSYVNLSHKAGVAVENNGAYLMTAKYYVAVEGDTTGRTDSIRTRSHFGSVGTAWEEITNISYNTWNTLSVPFQIPAGSTFYAELGSKLASDAIVYWDDIELAPYSGDMLAGAGKFDTKYSLTTSATAATDFIRVSSATYSESDENLAAGNVAYSAPGADGTGYAMKFAGNAGVIGIRIDKTSVPYGKDFTIKFKLKSDLVDTQLLQMDLSSGWISGTYDIDSNYPDAVKVSTTSWEEKQITIPASAITAKTTLTGQDVRLQVRTAATVSSGEVFFLDDVEIYEGTPVSTEYDVTISGTNAVTSVAAATSTGAAVNFTVAPKFGYYITGITIGGEAFTGFDAYKGGTYSTGAISADTAIVVTTAALADSSIAGVSNDVATLPAAIATTASTVTFGKVLDSNATSYGVELTQDGEGVLTYHGGGPLYKANSANANGQYAVEFVGLEAGEYTVRTYVIVDGVKTFGAPVTFTVE